MPGSRRFPHAVRSALVILLMLVLAGAAVLAVRRLHDKATSARDSQLTLPALRLYVAQIQQVPWGAAPGEGDTPAAVHDELAGDQLQIEQALDKLSGNGWLPDRERIERPFRRTTGALWE